MTSNKIFIPAPVYHHPVEIAMLARVAEDGNELVSKYIVMNERHGVYFIARDAAKLLFPEFLADKTRHNRYADGAASCIADAARRTLLSRPVSSSRDQVTMLTGCPASGKTGAALPGAEDKVEIQHETILTNIPRTVDLIEQILSAGRFPVIRLIYLDDPRIHVRRMINRARTIGRTVPIRYMAETYVGVTNIVHHVAELFGSRVTIQVTNNSEAPHQAVHHNRIERALYHIGRYNQLSALEAMHAELDAICAGPDGVPATILDEARAT